MSVGGEERDVVRCGIGEERGERGGGGIRGECESYGSRVSIVGVYLEVGIEEGGHRSDNVILGEDISIGEFERAKGR